MFFMPLKKNFKKMKVQFAYNIFVYTFVIPLAIELTKLPGRLAQLVQSTSFTPRGSGVRIPQRPHLKAAFFAAFFLSKKNELKKGPLIFKGPFLLKNICLIT